ncbi:chromatin remodeling complex subunit [Phlyctema vagabunda]|uniref:Chromatin remodeling complex subunit n=1 Tax=Phlyctema vagabunda TaxID=108571 RepID=A0ABR4P7X8_9HELO
MAGKKSGKALLREEGLERTDNGMKQTSWPETPMINQKNYYTEYMKRDDQILTLRLQSEANRDKMIRDAKDRDRALARTGNIDIPLPENGDGQAEEDEAAAADELDASKVIVVHFGSQNLRIGFANDALPKTIPMTIACKFPVTEAEEHEARPRRQKDNGRPEELFGEEFSKKFTKMSNDLKIDMRANKRKVLPNSKELVVNFNRRTPPEKIPEHNDPMRIEWTDIAVDKSREKYNCDFFTGVEAQRIPDDSKPKYKLFWPIQNGWFHEREYLSRNQLEDDIESILETALRKDLGLKSSHSWREYSCVFVIPDLYEKKVVDQVLNMCLKEIEFKQVAFIQESLAATYGAGYTSACIVDVGAQKTSICCVEDGLCMEDSRINLKYGGNDVTETFVKMMLYDHFPYADINLKRRYDFLLAEELKIQFCTMNQADISVRLYNFHLRAPNQPTRKYEFKTYDEVILAPMGFYDPSLFDNSEKLDGRRKWFDRSYNAYDSDIPDDPTSAAQLAILTGIKPSLATTANGLSFSNGNGNPDLATPSKEKAQPFNFLSRMDSEANGASRATSAAASPVPEGSNTPIPAAPFIFNANGTNGGSPGPAMMFGNGSHNGGTPIPPAGMFVDPHARTAKDLAIERDAVLPIAPLDSAIITSIQHAAKGDEKKVRDFVGGIMVIGGGAKTPGFGPFLEEKLKARRPDLAEKVLVGTSPREMDGQVVVWKGASVFARMKTHESWVGRLEYERLGSRVLHTKVMWHY